MILFNLSFLTQILKPFSLSARLTFIYWGLVPRQTLLSTW